VGLPLVTYALLRQSVITSFGVIHHASHLQILLLLLPRYKLTFYATDGTAEAGMFCFDSIVKQIIGKPCEFLIKTLGVLQCTPPDLSAIIGLKFTFAVNININSYYSRDKILNVNSILQAHGRQQPLPALEAVTADEDPLETDEPICPLLTQDSPATALQKPSTSSTTSSVRLLLQSL
jgi:hypothetical protein